MLTHQIAFIQFANLNFRLFFFKERRVHGADHKTFSIRVGSRYKAETLVTMNLHVSKWDSIIHIYNILFCSSTSLKKWLPIIVDYFKVFEKCTFLRNFIFHFTDSKSLKLINSKEILFPFVMSEAPKVLVSETMELEKGPNLSAIDFTTRISFVMCSIVKDKHYLHLILSPSVIIAVATSNREKTRSNWQSLIELDKNQNKRKRESIDFYGTEALTVPCKKVPSR